MGSINKSQRITGVSLIKNGIIIGRRSLGRNLAFAEVAIAESPTDDYNVDASKSMKVMFNRQSFLGPISTTDAEKTDIDIDYLGDYALLDDSFPTKKSCLPYGAKILLLLGKSNKMSIDDGDHPCDFCTWEVVRWKILDHPKEIAERVASFNRHSATAEDQLVKLSNHNQYDNPHEIVMGNGALSCSTYLKIRRGQFDNVYSGKSNSFRKNADRKDQAGLISKHEQTPKITETEEEVTVTAACCHGDKYAKGKRSKIFAAWVLETFFGMRSPRERIYCEPCDTDTFESDPKHYHEPLLNDDGSFIQNIHVLDIAGGKGHLSLELVLQQLSCGLSRSKTGPISRISKCTIIDPVVRKGDAKMRQSRLKKRQIPHSIAQINTKHCDTEIPTITHLATCFTADSFPSIHEKIINSFDNKTSSSEKALPRKLLFLGLHPDQCTEDIVDVALENNIPFAVVPCCVFPDLFVTRNYVKEADNHPRSCEGGRKLLPTRTYSEFVEYLRQKDGRIRMTALPFKGKNIVLYRQ